MIRCSFIAACEGTSVAFSQLEWTFENLARSPNFNDDFNLKVDGSGFKTGGSQCCLNGSFPYPVIDSANNVTCSGTSTTSTTTQSPLVTTRQFFFLVLWSYRKVSEPLNRVPELFSMTFQMYLECYRICSRFSGFF